MPQTITEALAELKLIKGKVTKKKDFVCGNVGRQDGIKDPFAKDGGTAMLNKGEMQAINDLSERYVRIRAGIATANAKVKLEIGGVSRSVSDWLIWRREVAPLVRGFQADLMRSIAGVRADAQKRNFGVVKPGEEPKQATDVIIEVDELDLTRNIEKTAEILDLLDGKLSLHNATVLVEGI